MIVTTALWITLGILAFFVALFSIRIRVTIEMQNELSLKVWAFGYTLRILPKKQKKYKISDYTPKKIAKRDKKNAEKEKKKALKKAAKKAEKAKKKAAAKNKTPEEKKAERAKKKASRPPLPDMISLLLKILNMFFGGFFARFHFHVAKIHVTVGSGDAATTALLWCAISTALKPILILLDKKSNLHGMKKADIRIVADYGSEEIKPDVKLAFSMSIGALLGVLLKAGFSFIFGWMKIKPKLPQDLTAEKKAPNKD